MSETPRCAWSATSTDDNVQDVRCSELVRCGNRVDDSDLRRAGCAHRADQGLDLRLGEELFELLRRPPLVHDDYDSVADSEAVVKAPRTAGFLSDGGELARPIRHRISEHGGIAREFADDQYAHDNSHRPLSWAPSLRRYCIDFAPCNMLRAHENLDPGWLLRTSSRLRSRLSKAVRARRDEPAGTGVLHHGMTITNGVHRPSLSHRPG